MRRFKKNLNYIRTTSIILILSKLNFVQQYVRKHSFLDISFFTGMYVLLFIYEVLFIYEERHIHTD